MGRRKTIATNESATDQLAKRNTNSDSNGAMKPIFDHLENKFKELAKTLGASVSKNESKGMWTPEGYEELGIHWTKDDLVFLLQIYPDVKGDRIRHWVMWTSCYKDVNGVRYWRKKVLMKTPNKNHLIEQFDSLVKVGLEYLASLSFEDLEKVQT